MIDGLGLGVSLCLCIALGALRAEENGGLDAPVLPPAILNDASAEVVVLPSVKPPASVAVKPKVSEPTKKQQSKAVPTKETLAKEPKVPVRVAERPTAPSVSTRSIPPARVDRTPSTATASAASISQTERVSPVPLSAPARSGIPLETRGEMSLEPPIRSGPAMAETVVLQPQQQPQAHSQAQAQAQAQSQPQTQSRPAPTASAITGRIERAGPPVQHETANGKEVVLNGTLDRSCELGPEHSPVVFEGNVIIPPGVTLWLKAGTLVHLRADPTATPAAQVGSPDPTKSAVVWILGSLLMEGVTGNPVEIHNRDREDAHLLFYGSEQSRMDGVRLKGLGVAQSGGQCLWTNCEFVGVKHYALASGAATFTQCSFRSCGGIFASYSVAPWALLARRCLFDNCREGVVLGGNPGVDCLVVEKNHFIRTRGAHLRVVPPTDAGGLRSSNAAPGLNGGSTEVLIGENWYGSTMPEEIDQRIVDIRNDRSLKIRMNTRPPAEQPYLNTGAGVTAPVLAATLRDQESVLRRLLQAFQAKLPRPADGPEPSAMNGP